MKKNIITLIISILLITGITFTSGLFINVSNIYLKILLLTLLNLLNGSIAVIAMKITNMKLNLDIKNKKQYLIGICIAIILSLSIACIPALLGFSLVGQHTNFSWFSIIYNFLFYIVIVGPVEELIFRVYIQDTCIDFFNKNKWIGVIIASAVFGLWHFINGSFIQVLFTFAIGLVFGFSKYLIKDSKYLGLALGHGLYDFFNVIVRMFIV